MPDVFISYRHAAVDTEFAHGLADFLITSGLDVFIDRDIKPGSEWDTKIDEALDSCSSFVILISEHSIRSDPVLGELQRAYERLKDGNVRMVPVFVDFNGKLPYSFRFRLSRIQRLNWSTGDQRETTFERALAAIQGTAPGEAEPESPEETTPPAEPAAPLPVADLTRETGAISAASRFYVRRDGDERMESLLGNPNGQTIRICGPRQIGKTSMINVAMAWARDRGYQICFIDFQDIDSEHLESLTSLCRHLADAIADELDSAIEVADVWNNRLGAKRSLTKFVDRAVIKGAESPVLLCLDEVDRVFQREYPDNFFGMVRSWHNRRSNRPGWEKLHVLLGHSTDPSRWIQDPNQSPFNVGEGLQPQDFDVSQIRESAGQHEMPNADLPRLMEMVGGHPFLVRQAFYTMASEGVSLDELEARALEPNSPFLDHLRGLGIHLRRNDRLKKAIRIAMKHKRCENEDDFDELRAAGIITGETRDKVAMRCGLYAEYFRQHL